MPGWLEITLVIVGGLLVVFFGVGAMLPRAFEVSRSIVIAAPPETIHPFVDSLRNWPSWSPFDTEIEDIAFDLKEPSSGVGATRTWTSGRMGDGSQEIVASDPETGVSMRLVMTCVEHGSDIRFAREPANGGTRVTWTDRGQFPASPHWRWMGNLFVGSMLGGMFERGLAALKRSVEETAGAGSSAGQRAKIV